MEEEFDDGLVGYDSGGDFFVGYVEKIEESKKGV